MNCRFCKNLDECIWMSRELKIEFNPDTPTDLCEQFRFYLNPMASRDHASLVFIERYIDELLNNVKGCGEYYHNLERCRQFIKNNPDVGKRAFLLQGYDLRVRDLSKDELDDFLQMHP